MNAIVFDRRTFGSLSQIATEPVACGLSTIFRMASRTRSAMRRPDRAAALRSASKLFLAEVKLDFWTHL